MTMRTGVLVAALTLMLRTSDVLAGLTEGVEAYERGDYVTAMKELRPLADQGNADAQFFMGLIYDNGHGVAPDHGRAVEWWRLAAAQGHARAEYSLGHMYQEDNGND